jgi:hypothetical protein
MDLTNLEAIFRGILLFRGKLEFGELFRGNLFYLEANYFASVEIEANSRAKFSIRGKLFLGMKWGHFLFGGLIWMSWTLILRLRQHS